MYRLLHAACGGLLVMGLAACEGNDVKNTLGLERRAPDEFRVISRPPLSVPPEFSLRPPAEPGEVTPNREPTYLQAQRLMLGNGYDDVQGGVVHLRPGTADTAITSVSSGELGNVADSNFLAQAGAQLANPSIRDILREENTVPLEEQDEEGWLDSINVFKKKDPVVNAPQEAERIQANKDAGKPITAGETPMVSSKNTGPLGRLLGM